MGTDDEFLEVTLELTFGIEVTCRGLDVEFDKLIDHNFLTFYWLTFSKGPHWESVWTFGA